MFAKETEVLSLVWVHFKCFFLFLGIKIANEQVMIKSLFKHQSLITETNLATTSTSFQDKTAGSLREYLSHCE